MNPKYFGDSYDIVKRFFVGILKESGYSVAVEPMFTGDWKGQEAAFIKFIAADSIGIPKAPPRIPSALLIDPDTGIGERHTARHIVIEDIMDRLATFDVVVTYDQAFSRARRPQDEMSEKLLRLHRAGYPSLYYDSHAKFLFSFRTHEELSKVRAAIVNAGIPEHRLHGKDGA